ncbi:ribosomal protein S9 [Gimesia maris DSM 8797]|uniref:Small ribosomal subunit protein uS9 n=1 Tax=Gimesia maris TaxID=122 RepID=A0ABX5YHE7_9PLAN|nr:ribosomal protein S9 [Gimesia maris DSM 8797]QDU13062.1 30S ribosomal protein S9 [Gimesia maris]QEG14992.1 30S ribosomal protein S9 [Gimesia maris]
MDNETPEEEVTVETTEQQTPVEAETATSEEATADSMTTTSGVPELTLGSGVPAEAEEDEVVKPEPVIRGKLDKHGVAMGTGRRKTAVARVRIKAGSGSLTINGQSLNDYLRVERDRQMVEAPLKATETFGKVDVWVRVTGGGTTGQTGAIVLGIARALEAYNNQFHETLSAGRFLTRDSRMVERKKFGFKKARKSFQFSKR